jgi:hypothetical protein
LPILVGRITNESQSTLVAGHGEQPTAWLIEQPDVLLVWLQSHPVLVLGDSDIHRRYRAGHGIEIALGEVHSRAAMLGLGGIERSGDGSISRGRGLLMYASDPGYVYASVLHERKRSVPKRAA